MEKVWFTKASNTENFFARLVMSIVALIISIIVLVFGGIILSSYYEEYRVYIIFYLYIFVLVLFFLILSKIRKKWQVSKIYFYRDRLGQLFVINTEVFVFNNNSVISFFKTAHATCINMLRVKKDIIDAMKQGKEYEGKGKLRVVSVNCIVPNMNKTSYTVSMTLKGNGFGQKRRTFVINHEYKEFSVLMETIESKKIQDIELEKSQSIYSFVEKLSLVLLLLCILVCILSRTKYMTDAVYFPFLGMAFLMFFVAVVFHAMKKGF